MIPATNQIVLKAISIDDIGVTVVELPQGTYLIDGEVVASQLSWPSSNRQVSVKDLDNIRQIIKRNILVRFVDKDGCELTSDEYVQTKCGLEKHINYNDILDETEWDSLESEFEYRKFMQRWKPVYKEETSYSEPLLVDKTHIRQDTGNPYIVAGFLTGRADVPLYSYSRTAAVAGLLEKKFESLGMVFQQNVNYAQTQGKKIWGNSTHSGLEYVTAFGSYIIGKNLVKRTVGEFKGSLDHLTKLYEEDKEWIENHIQTLYNLHFRNEAASGVLLSEVFKQAKLVLTYVNTMEVKARSETSKREAVTQINKLIDLVNKEILEK